MAKRMKWYIVTSARAQAVSLPGNDAKLMPRGTRFQAAAKDVNVLLRRKVIRELQEREVPISLRFPNYGKATKEEKEDTIAVLPESPE